MFSFLLLCPVCANSETVPPISRELINHTILQVTALENMSKILETSGSGLRQSERPSHKIDKGLSEMNSVYISVCFYFSTNVSNGEYG
jgi:hypothetical protein